MQLDDYAIETRRTWIQAQSPDLNLMHMFTGLAEEAGEVCGIAKRYARGDYSSLAYAREKLVKELGDLLYYIARVADHFQINLNDILESNLSKLCDRQSRGVLQGSGDNR